MFEEVTAAAAVIDSMVELRSLEQRNAGALVIYIVQGQLADCRYRYDFRCQATDTASNELIAEVSNAQNRRHAFYVEMLTGILGRTSDQTRSAGPAVDVRTQIPSVDVRMQENLDFDRIEAAVFWGEQAVADAAVALVGLRQTYSASSEEVDGVVTALPDRQEEYCAACGTTDRADMVLIAEIRSDRRLRRDTVAHH
ncbi:hypothetical protein V7S43_007125 [Phytophthora oleae]|uniref:Uncharacterized protein n=1 Tax=Phytophthora oleae TaxID=2107226 RepID=A0ABD3FPE4_9STRA